MSEQEEGFDFDLERTGGEPAPQQERPQVRKEGFDEVLSPGPEEKEARKLGGPKRRKVATVKKGRQARKPPASKPPGPSPEDRPIREAFPTAHPGGPDDLSEAATQRIPGHKSMSELESEGKEPTSRDFLEIPPGGDEPVATEPPDVSTVEVEPRLPPEVPLSAPNVQLDSSMENVEGGPLADEPDVSGVPVPEIEEVPIGDEHGPGAVDEVEIKEFPVADALEVPSVADDLPPEKHLSGAVTEEIPIAEPAGSSEPDAILEQEFRDFMGGEFESGEGPPVPAAPSADPTESVREYKAADPRDLDTPYSKEELENLFTEDAKPTPPWEKPKTRRRRDPRTSRRARRPTGTSSGKLLLLIILFGVLVGLSHWKPVKAFILPKVVRSVTYLGLGKYFPAYVGVGSMASAPEVQPAEGVGTTGPGVGEGKTEPGVGEGKTETPDGREAGTPTGAVGEKPPEERDPALDAFLSEAERSERFGIPRLMESEEALPKRGEE